MRRCTLVAVVLAAVALTGETAWAQALVPIPGGCLEVHAFTHEVNRTNTVPDARRSPDPLSFGYIYRPAFTFLTTPELRNRPEAHIFVTDFLGEMALPPDADLAKGFVAQGFSQRRTHDPKLVFDSGRRLWAIYDARVPRERDPNGPGWEMGEKIHVLALVPMRPCPPEPSMLRPEIRPPLAPAPDLRERLPVKPGPR